MRIPGEGTEQLIDRREEAAVYQTIDGKKICDDIAYINPENGYKITEFLEGARVCDPDSPGDVEKCMKRLRRFHEMKLQVEHTFDIFGQMEFYESCGVILHQITGIIRRQKSMYWNFVHILNSGVGKRY